MKDKHIFHVARECEGIVPGGGVGEAVRALALKCAEFGVESSIIIPRYKVLKCESTPQGKVYGTDIPVSYVEGDRRVEHVEISLHAIECGEQELKVWLVDSSRFGNKSHPYTYTAKEAELFQELPPGATSFCGAEPPPFGKFEDIRGRGHHDFFAMNVLFQKAVVYLIQSLSPQGAVVHCHDGHVATIPLLAKKAGLRNCKFVVTAHNCGRPYRQGCSDERLVAAILGIAAEEVMACTVDGAFDPLAAAAIYADAFNTVSEGYAWEVEMAWRPTWPRDEQLRAFSAFLALKRKRIIGITNGIDPSLKGPEALPLQIRPPIIDADFVWKDQFKRGFLERIAQGTDCWRGVKEVIGDVRAFGPANCLFTFVGSLTNQNAPDVIIRAVEEVFAFDDSATLCMLGDGDEQPISQKVHDLAARFPGRVVVFTGFNADLSAEIYAAGDFFLIPSRYEPCGLIDCIAQLNGNLPIANQVGGLSKIVDGATGLGYFAVEDHTNLRGLVATMRDSLRLFKNSDELMTMRRTADAHVRTKHNWDVVFEQYLSLYK